jgi:Na+-translocating ferredoxin:NAD+ oxidoreductase RnfG subunit
MNRIRLYLFLTIAVSMAAGHVLLEEKRVDESLYLGEVAPDVTFGNKEGSPLHYSSPDGVTAFNSFDVTPSIKGYAGPIKLLVALEPGGRITGLKVLEHKETPNYVHRMEKPEFLGQFLGKSVNEPLEMDVDIDGISRATVSVKALTESVRESSREVASRAMGVRVIEKKERGGLAPGWIAYLLFFLFSFSLYFITRRPRYSGRLQRARDAVMVISVLLVGLWLSSPFSILHVLNVALFRISSDMLLSVIFLSTVISIALAGRFYCGWLCPFGALSEFLSRIPLKKWAVPAKLDDGWRNIKYWLLGLVAAAVLLSGKVAFGNFETYVTLFSFHGTAFTWAIVVIGLLASLRVRRFWCRYLCPVAALAGLFSRQDPVYVSTGNCPMANRHEPLNSECIRCNRCCK